MKFNKISSEAFQTIQFGAGMVLKTFNPAEPPTTIADENIVCTTTGGVQASCVATYTDLAEDVDNAPKNMMEYKQLEEWECKLSFTALDLSLDGIKLALGAADVDTTNGKVTPRSTVSLTDFTTVWWVGDLLGDGGWAAVQLFNALGTGGFSMQTTDKGKGNFEVELTGHVSKNAQNVVPMEFYVTVPDGETGDGN